MCYYNPYFLVEEPTRLIHLHNANDVERPERSDSIVHVFNYDFFFFGIFRAYVSIAYEGSQARDQI